MSQNSDSLTAECSGNFENQPLVSICIPVFNEEKYLERTIKSVLSQTYGNFELVISDNASTDKTQAICHEFAEKDSRVKYFRSPEKVSQNENFNRVFKLSSGQFTLWMGGHDWLDPNYIEQCVAKFVENPETVLVTTYTKHIDDKGVEHYLEYKGTRLNLESPCKRFSRMLWFLTTSHLHISPIFSLMRRSALEKTKLIGNILYADLIFALEMSLLGPWGHIPKCLQFRKHPDFAKPKETIKRYGLKQSSLFCRIKMCFVVIRTVWEKDFLRLYEKFYCVLAVIKYYLRVQRKRAFGKLLNIIRKKDS